MHRKAPPEVFRREGRVQAEPDRAALALLLETLAQQRRQQHQVVVVDPDQVVGFRFCGDYIGEDLVDALVSCPGFLVEVYPGLIVHDWPEDGVC